MDVNTEVDVKTITEAVKDVSVNDKGADADNGNISEETKEDGNNEVMGVTIRITDETGKTKTEEETSQDETTEDTTALEAVNEV